MCVCVWLCDFTLICGAVAIVRGSVAIAMLSCGEDAKSGVIPTE